MTDAAPFLQAIRDAPHEDGFRRAPPEEQAEAMEALANSDGLRRLKTIDIHGTLMESGWDALESRLELIDYT